MTRLESTPGPLPALPASADSDYAEYCLFACRTPGCGWRSDWFDPSDRSVPALDAEHTAATGHQNIYLYRLSRTPATIATVGRPRTPHREGPRP
ncbi:hypothetical protein [Nocardia sp. NPDC003963]